MERRSMCAESSHMATTRQRMNGAPRRVCLIDAYPAICQNTFSFSFQILTRSSIKLHKVKVSYKFGHANVMQGPHIALQMLTLVPQSAGLQALYAPANRLKSKPAYFITTLCKFSIKTRLMRRHQYYLQEDAKQSQTEN